MDEQRKQRIEAAKARREKDNTRNKYVAGGLALLLAAGIGANYLSKNFKEKAGNTLRNYLTLSSIQNMPSQYGLVLNNQTNFLKNYPSSEQTVPVQQEALLEAKKISKNSLEQVISPELVLALVQVESGGVSTRISSAGAMGVGQIMPATWNYVTEEIYGKELPLKDAMNPDLNLEVTIHYLHYLDKYLSSRIEGYEKMPLEQLRDLLMAAYNGGPSRLAITYRGDISKMPFESQNHAKKVSLVLENNRFSEETLKHRKSISRILDRYSTDD